jgi:hypothetical protein
MQGILAEITRLAPKPGEVLLVKFTQIRPDRVDEMKRMLNEFMAERFPGTRVLAITGRIDVALISAECADEIESLNA